ncbi:MAG: TldD/PmbA family protein [Pseudomonadota bacterium]
MIDYKNIASDTVTKAKKAGADHVDVIIRSNVGKDVEIRLGKIEKLNNSETKGLGLRIFKNQKASLTYTSDFSSQSIDKLIKKTIDLCEISGSDEFRQLPDPKYLGRYAGKLNLFDSTISKIPMDKKLEIAKRVEEIGRSKSKYITNTEGAWWSDGEGSTTLANSHGFCDQTASTNCSFGVFLVAEKNNDKFVDYWYSSNRFYNNLESVESVANEAAQRLLRKLDFRKPKTQKVPIVFDPFIARSLLSSLLEASSGYSVYQKSSFFIDKLGKKVANDKFNLIDDGTMIDGQGSAPFDDEGIKTNKNVIIDNGILNKYLCDTYSGLKLNMTPTGNASRGYSSNPRVSSTNLYLDKGEYSPEQIISSVKNGLYLTNFLGGGTNPVTGDYSQGAAGVWITDGKLDYSVQEFTVAGNMLDMISNIEMIGNDLDFRTSTACPTILIPNMMISGA